MGQQLVVGPFNKGLETNRLGFYIDNDAFPYLQNAYVWRGRVKRKRGTQLLSRLNRLVTSTASNPIMILDGSGNGSANLISVFSLQTNASIKLSSISFSDGTNTFTEPAIPDGTLVGSPSGSGTINYATGAVTITGGTAGQPLIGTFTYYPSLPVMGLEELQLTSDLFPGTVAFDTIYSYQFNTSNNTNKDISFYKNPGTGAYAGYTAKSALTPFVWSGNDYQQFWTCNYQNAFWATNGNPGMQFQTIKTITYASATTLTIVVTNSPAVIGDFVWINEVTGTNNNRVNQQTGYVTNISGSLPGDITLMVKFPNVNITNNAYSGGMLQYLTNSVSGKGDGIRWYDGDPASSSGKGWVNFAPPLESDSDVSSIGDSPASQYYLCGAKMIVPFKDRLLFIGPYITTSTTTHGNEIYLQDYVIFSEVGTPFYTSSYDFTTIPTTYPQILVPINQVATPKAFWTDQVGFGGYISAGVDQPIRTVNQEKDVLIVGFSNRFAQITYSGNDILPFVFYSITQEWGAANTFASINFDRGAVTMGNFGLTRTGIEGSERIDLNIPDAIFEVDNKNNGAERICGQRDYINEWIYFTYVTPSFVSNFPNQTLFYNYRDGTWAIFNEAYTTYGTYRKTTGYTWNTLPYANWNEWTTPWNYGSANAENPIVIGGNQQGFVLQKDVGTNEGTSLYIQNISAQAVTGSILITCFNHGLASDDYIIVSGCLGTIGSVLNGNIYSVNYVDANSFTLNPTSLFGSNTYLGGGLITRMYVPYIQTKQFPVAWSIGRKTRIGRQNYLFTETDDGQLTVAIFLNQDNQNPYNNPPIVPSPGSTNNSLVYSDIVYTSPEYEVESLYNNLTGKFGDGSSTTINILYDTIYEIPFGIVPGSIIIKVGSTATFTDNGSGAFTVTGTGVSGIINYTSGNVSLVFSSAPSISDQFISSFQYYAPSLQMLTGSSQQQIWHRMNTSLIGDTVQLGFTLSDTQMRDADLSNQFSEIELHGFIIDLNTSSVLA